MIMVMEHVLQDMEELVEPVVEVICVVILLPLAELPILAQPHVVGVEDIVEVIVEQVETLILFTHVRVVTAQQLVRKLALRVV